MTIWTKAFWKGALDRAIKTFFQTFVAVLVAGVGADAVGISAGILDAPWLAALSVSALATFLSIATAVGNADNTAKDASLDSGRGV
ncbi:holin [Auritidibacter ignavus]|uniref:Holin n=1 Tax=Auritidibacter ignavus TaxID=678932 RepID=A0AAJ6AQ95_9MICC|nr:holin [Auritidibacter ignavus]NIH72202.1 ABC-type multidrug transport system fused ATPase/permease subunit [Auritidibacter ignavus]WGH82538.1 holin [Auritidibacter ignavus]WGH91733.1 holin [Auritidibacter ignavus]WGH94180.1 holin [Auritidibacter ignavus]WHS27526.1 holin [Auritidibacter ignavus]